ncbi:hypothetical protein LTR49_009781 [Elasticomyces elasticus]|nr:hypothetical protein LTR49_009781 [Elasticomyces elasticus]
MTKYEALLKQGRCLCRQALEQLNFDCCATRVGPVGGLISSRASPEKNVGRWASTATSTATELRPQCSYDDTTTVKTTHALYADRSQQDDIEQTSAREHVVLSVSGMTCTGCSKKFMNVLNRTPGISSPQVTFVSGSAEFDVDTSVVGEFDATLSRIEKETGFRCSRIVDEYHELCVLMSASSVNCLENSNMPGLVSVTKRKDQTYRITFNPRIVGARSLLPPDARLASPEQNAVSTDEKRRLTRAALNTALAASLTIPVVVLEWSNNPIPHTTRSIVTLVLATLVQGIAVPEFYIGAMKSLVYSRVVEMDMLVVISITAAYVYSVVAFGLTEAGVDLEQKSIFETSTLLITLVLLGRLMAAWARMRAISAVSPRSLQVETALLLSPTGETAKVDARLLEFEDCISVPPHSRIVTDGKVISGSSAVDESMLTGESIPVGKEVGSEIIAGTMNGDGTLQVRITRLPAGNSITEIANLVEKAVAARPRVQELADKVASWFITAVVGIAVVVFCIWIAVAITLRNRSGGGAVGVAITYAIAVLAISCPCALGLAVPMVLVIAGGVAARAGLVIKAADAIERAPQVTDVVFDKTGTLTESDLRVVQETVLPTDTLREKDILSLCKAIVEGNEHPVSTAISSHLASQPLPANTHLQNVTSVPGAGITAQYNSSAIKAGNPYWLNLATHPEILSFFHRALTVLCVTVDDRLVLIYGLKSTLRPNAAALVAELHHRGITCHIVSGDNAAVVQDVTRTLDIPNVCVLARSSPAEKQQYVQRIQGLSLDTNGRAKIKKAKRCVLFLGDGTNDAIAIAQADIGMQMGSASDVTGAVADVVLLSQDLKGLLGFLDLSRAAVTRIMFNFIWSGIYNIFAILLASGAFVKVRIPAAYAGLGEIVSVGPVVLGAMSLMWVRKRTG